MALPLATLVLHSPMSIGSHGRKWSFAYQKFPYHELWIREWLKTMRDKYWESLLDNFGPSSGAQPPSLCTPSERHLIKTWY